jgi:protein O-mannosyl-transferase
MFISIATSILYGYNFDPVEKMKKPILIALAAIMLTIIIFTFYASALKLNFLYSDDYVVIKTSHLAPSEYYLGNWMGGRGIGGLSRPIIISSVKLDGILWGVDPFGYHLSNVIYHAINAFFVFLIAYFILNDYLFALASGALFALLPMNAEAVNWMCCRCDLIATMFYLAAFYGYLLYSKRGYKPGLMLSMAAFVLALGSKESALTLPLIVLFYEYLNGGLKNKAKIIGAYFLIFIPYFVIRYLSLGTFLGGYKVGFKRAVFSVFLGIFKTIQLVALPFIQERLLMYFILLPLIALALLILIVLYIRRSRPASIFYFFLLWPLITLLPVAHVLSVGFDFRGSRWWYLPSIGISWLIAYFAFHERYGSNKKMVAIAKTACFIFFVYSCFFLVQINNVWTKASDMTRTIRAEAIRLVERYPKGSKICFWNIPDNYKGCYVGMPFLETPFYESRFIIRGYQDDYLYYSDLSKRFNIDKCDNYVFNVSDERFKKVAASYIKKYNIPRIFDNYDNKRRFKGFLRGSK